MRNALIEHVESKFIKDNLPNIEVGDTVDVDVRIIEGSKERIQTFNGVIIEIHGNGATKMFTVRRIVANQGVERIFPLHSPAIAEIRIVRKAHTRRSKLFFLRHRVGKSRRLPDRRRGLKK